MNRYFTINKQLKFIIVWGSQTLSEIGSGLTSFAFGLWIYLQSHSLLHYGLIAFLSHFPEIILAPIAGVVSDFYGKKKIMIISDTASAIIMLWIAITYYSNMLTVWHVYVAAILLSICNIFHFLAYSTGITTLVEPKFYTRANGLLQLSIAFTRFIAPIFAVFLLNKLKLSGIATLDFITYVFAAFVLIFFDISTIKIDLKLNLVSKMVFFFKQQFYGFNYHRHYNIFKFLLFYFMFINYMCASFFIILTPLMIKLYSQTIAAMIMSAAGGGALLGSIIMSLTNTTKKNISYIIYGPGILGLVVLLASLQSNLYFWFAAVFVFSMVIPFVYGSCQTIYQSQVEAGLQGRVFGFRRTALTLFLVLGYLLGPWVAEIFCHIYSIFQIANCQVLGMKSYLFIISSITLITVFYMYRKLNLMNVEFRMDSKLIVEKV